MNLTIRNRQEYHSPALEKDSAGIGVLFGAAMSRKQHASGFFSPVRPVMGGQAGGPQGRRCSIGTPTPVLVAHPIGVGLAVTHRNWSKTMTQQDLGVFTPPDEESPAFAVDRSIASAINPLISSIWTEDTLQAVASVVYEVGFMVAETDLAKENTFRIFEAAAAALWWEGKNIHSCRMIKEMKNV